ncbi:MAG: VWA domain-containing protein [Caulobacterales bacterium]|nr:VWA domain-containing protein [Caulobacterales bacterium]
MAKQKKLGRSICAIALLGLFSAQLSACSVFHFDKKDKIISESQKITNSDNVATIDIEALNQDAKLSAKEIKKQKLAEEEILKTDFKCPAPIVGESRNYFQKGVAKMGVAAPYVYAPMPAPPPMPANIKPIAKESLAFDASGKSHIPMPFPNNEETQNTEKYPNAIINSIKLVKEQAVSTFAMEVDSASYTNVRRILNEGSLPPSQAVRVEEFLNYFKYDYKSTSDKNAPFATNIIVTQSPWNQDKQILHIGLKGFDNIKKDRPPLNLVLLLDVSGSMSAENKLPLVKRAIISLLPKLTAEDKVSIVVYAGASGLALKPTAGNETRDIVCALENMQAGGSTAGGEGLRLAYNTIEKNYDKKAINRVILMTDGDFNVGITNPKHLSDFVAEKRQKGIYLSVFGFGGDNYNDETMQSLAQTGNGIAAYIDSLSEAKRVLNQEFTSTMFPIANDVKAQIEFNPLRVAEWRLIGYETRALNREDFNNDKVDAGEIGAGHQVTALYEITPIGGKPSVDPLRYQNDDKISASKTGEIGFLKLRYKTPNEDKSKLIERSITNNDIVKNLDDAPNSTKLAIAIASFGQKLRNDPWIGNYSFDQIIELAESTQDDDKFGQIEEFINLVKKSKSLSHLNSDK